MLALRSQGLEIGRRHGLDGPVGNRRVHAPLDRETARALALSGFALTPRCLTNPNFRIFILNGRARPTRHL